MAADNAEALLEQLSYVEAAFLMTAADPRVLAFQPREDPLIVRLLESGFLNSVRGADPSHETLIISDKGRRVVDLIMGERE